MGDIRYDLTSLRKVLPLSYLNTRLVAYTVSIPKLDWPGIGMVIFRTQFVSGNQMAIAILFPVWFINGGAKLDRLFYTL
jgi:hypothetical protein